MKAEEVARKLRAMYDAAAPADRMLAVHLFGIKYGTEIEANGISAADLSRRAFPEKSSLGPQIAAGIKLSRYVLVKESPTRRTMYGRYAPMGGEKRAPMVCPYCEGDIRSFDSEYSQAQAETIVVVLCPHCRKVLGTVNHSCQD